MAAFPAQRTHRDAGIAIGPILFVIAILAILATAIAAGSSTFASSSSQETNRTNAASMIQIGQNLKMGVDRIVALGIGVTSVDINASNTSTNNALFSPLGGGLIPPSTALAHTPTTDAWHYIYGNVVKLGSASLDRIAFLKVTQGVCNQVLTQTNLGVTAENLTNIADLTADLANDANISGTWPNNQGGKVVGCVTDGTNYFFYQVLAVQ